MFSLAVKRGPLAALALVAAVLSLTPSAARAETAAGYMQRVANELIAASRNGSVQSFASVVRSHADLPSIRLTALGSLSPLGRGKVTAVKTFMLHCARDTTAGLLRRLRSSQ